MKSILMLCPYYSETDVHIKVTKTNLILYFLAAVGVGGSVSSLHQGATSFFVFTITHRLRAFLPISTDLNKIKIIGN